VIFFAQAEGTPSFFDNATLDRWEIPFGDWMDQGVDWIAVNMKTLLAVIEWPFATLIDFLVDDILVPASWVWVVLGMALIALLTRNLSVAVFVAVALTVAGLLGEAYWIETARTIGFIAVAVILSVIIGIPLGIAAGRFDSVWKVTRPVLDAMQVVHSFVYMLPFIFFWGIGEVSATMVTMIFALPPLIRLTNLGVRQVPEDVVEASRSYGAPEWRVLFDVQIPLARPAINTGINQTLLLAISMLGIAAIMGAGGLGTLLFRALSNQDVALAASAGLAFFLVAVVLDRMSQREDGEGGNLFKRIGQAWAHLRDPEALLPESGPVETAVSVGRYAPFGGKERTAMFITAVGAIVGAISVFLPWTADAGKISAYGNRGDEGLAGMVFNGLDASGGSFFGILVLILSLLVGISALVTFVRPGRGPRWLTVDGAVIFAFGSLLTAGSFLLANPSSLGDDPGTGLGLILAVIGSLVAAIGSVMWIRVAPHTPLHPLRDKPSWGRLVGVGVAIVVLVVGALGAWSVDGRADVIITDDVQAQIDDLKAQAAADPGQAIVYANEIAAIIATAQTTDAITIDGISSDSAGLGRITLLAGFVALLSSVPAMGFFSTAEHSKWKWSAITAGLGVGIAAIASAWILTFVRSADPNFVSGIGSFLTALGGLFIVGGVMTVLKEFRRDLLYDDVLVRGGDEQREHASERGEEVRA